MTEKDDQRIENGYADKAPFIRLSA